MTDNTNFLTVAEITAQALTTPSGQTVAGVTPATAAALISCAREVSTPLPTRENREKYATGVLAAARYIDGTITVEEMRAGIAP